MNNYTQGVLLAGGEGKRLSPFTSYTSKHLLPVGGYPMIYYPLKNLYLLGCDEVILVINPHHRNQWEKLIPHIPFDLTIRIVEQEKPLGLPHAIAACKNLVCDHFYVALGDNVIIASNFINHFRNLAKGSGAVIATFSTETPEQFGVVERGINNEIKNIIEKPHYFVSNEAVAGLYKFDATFFELFEKSTVSTRGEYEIVDILAEYNKLGSLRCAESNSTVDYWLDVGTMKAILKANNFIESLTVNTLYSMAK